MSLIIHMTSDAEETLRHAFGSELSEAVKESLIIRGYQTGKLSLGDVKEILGLVSRFQAEDWLGRRGVNWNYSPAELDEDRKALGELFHVKL